MYKHRLWLVCLLALSVWASEHTHKHTHTHEHEHGHGHRPGYHGSHGTSSEAPTPPTSDGQPVVVTPSGTIKGSTMETRRGRPFEAYRGIRYAEPLLAHCDSNVDGLYHVIIHPQPPKLIKTYSEVVDASQEGPACPLPAPPDYYVDEDCLRINIYTPGHNSTQPLPVIFFIHAGGFYAMTGRSDLAGPHYLLDRDIVLVTINYRLGSLGLFHRGVSMSASPTVPGGSPRDLNRLARRQAELLNCPTNSSRAIIDCLRTRTWRELGDSLPGFYEFGSDPIGIWLPVVEPDFGQERFLPIEPSDAIREGKMHAVPHIISQTQDEFFWKAFSVLKNESLRQQMESEWQRVALVSFQLPRDDVRAARRLRESYLPAALRDDAPSARALGHLYGDAIIGFPVHRMANLMCRHSPHPVYYYEFAYIGNHSHYEDPDTGRPTGAAHHDDLIYLFTLSYRFPTIPTTSPDSQLVDKMTAIWYTFAKHGDPNPRGDLDLPEIKDLKWPAMTPEKRSYLRIDKEFSVRTNLKEDRMQVWDELYPIAE